jgi:hypothetical protein
MTAMLATPAGLRRAGSSTVYLCPNNALEPSCGRQKARRFAPHALAIGDRVLLEVTQQHEEPKARTGRSRLLCRWPE